MSQKPKDEALYVGKRHYDKDGKPLGGIKVMVDESYMVEVEGGEYKICTEAYNSKEVLSFQNKTNKEILDYIHNNFSCKFEQNKANSGDFILCRLVVNDKKPKTYKGNVREILDMMQSEQSCRVSFGSNSMKKGGVVNDGEIAKRWETKKEHIDKIANSIRSLRYNVTKDLNEGDDKERLTALAIAIMDKTAERVGNSDSADNGHFGVTGFKKRHIKVVGDKVRLNYIGKSGVRHEKEFTDSVIAKNLKWAISQSNCEFVFCTDDGFRIKAEKINRYLSDYGISAKDIRGYSANRWIIDRLNAIEIKDIPETEQKRSRKFNKIVKSVAAKVGHGAATLKKHYLLPELESEFVEKGEIIDLSDFYKKGGKENLSKTPAPKSERIYGSKTNKPESAASKESAKEIKLSESVIEVIKNKIETFNKENQSKKIDLNTAKAVVRRGMGAYSVTHRPTISGGKPNSRVAWGLARLNAFLYKAETGKSKSGKYIQDDDLLDDLNIKHKKYESGGSVKRQIVGCIIHTPEQGFLLLQRGDSCEKNAGKWHILSGGVNSGESLHDAALREISEEICWNGEVDLEKLCTIDYGNYDFTYFLASIKDRVICELNFENKDFEWVKSIDEMLVYDLIPELREYMIDFNEGFKSSFEIGGSILLAPNGKPSNLTPEQYKLVRTKAFKDWFGDWENDPENASKVVDFNGEPLVCYHGTPKKFSIFKGYGHWFSNKKEITDNYGKNKYEVFLKVIKPFEILPLSGWDFEKNKKDEGGFYDNLPNNINWVVKNSTQIKLADGTNTTFDANNPDIRYADGGEVEDLIAEGIVDLKIYGTTPEHAKEYGIKSINPLYVQSIFVSKDKRLIGLGKKVLKYIEKYAVENGHDVVFGHITQKAKFTKDERETFFSDIDLIKNWLQSNGYAINDNNNDFHKFIQNNPDIRFDDGGAILLAPNGKPSNLTPEQYKLVRTPEFKAWFGDWENDPANASKVVDENGEPLLMYHGTLFEFNVFDKEYWGYNTFSDIKGFFFTNGKEEAQAYMEQNVIFGGTGNKIGFLKECFLNLKDPIIETIWDEDEPSLYIDNQMHLVKYNKGNGLIVKNQDKNWITAVVFEPNQIKLADGTNTTFDSSNPDIRYAGGGVIGKSRSMIPNVRGGWTKDKILRYLKEYDSDTITTYTLTKFISELNNWQELKSLLYYHGTTNYIERGLKPSIVFSERVAERIGGGGYGQRYWGISLTKRKRTAEAFSGMSRGVTIYPVFLKKDAVVIERTDLSDSSEVEDIIVELYENGIDAVWIGGGEEELVVVNPRSIMIYQKGSDSYTAYGGFKSKNLTDEEIENIYEDCKSKWSEYYKKYTESDKDNRELFIKSLEPIKFIDGGSVLLAPNGKPSNLTPEQYKLVRTPEFKAWFGDWENDPANASKVVDEETKEPLVVYHGTDKQFNVFKKDPKNPYAEKQGYFFAFNKKYAESYNSKYVKECFINIRITGTYDDDDMLYPINADGVILDNLHVEVFDNKNIKLADGTNTTFDSSNPDIRFAGGGSVLLAPNGKPSNLTPEQYKLVRTPEFKAWFGDWEKLERVKRDDPAVDEVTISNLSKDVSKIVDENGEPLVVYKGGHNDIYRFHTHRIGRDGKEIYGSYFSSSKVVAESYLENTIYKGEGVIYEVFLSLKNPLIVNAENRLWNVAQKNEIITKNYKGDIIDREFEYKSTDSISRQAKENNNDGIIVLNVVDSGSQKVFELGVVSNTYAAFEPNQIKLADGTNTTFDSSNPDIRFAGGGSVLLAPNGKPSNLTPEQYKLVRTPEFKAWFGDWENDPANASKVVDENGEPLPLYHGSRSEFNIFDYKRSGASNTTAKVGFWFTPIKKFAENFASTIWYGESDKVFVYSVFLSIKNPKIYESENVSDEEKEELRLQIKNLQNQSLSIQKKWVEGDWDYKDRMVLDYSIRGMINDKNYDYYSKFTNKSVDAINDGILIAEINKKKKEIENKIWGATYTDSYQKYRTDIYKHEGKSADEANTGGLGMALSDPMGTITKYVQSLTENGYDGILISKTRFDKREAGDFNDQYVALFPNQIKLADGTNTTFDIHNPDIRYEGGGKLEKEKNHVYQKWKKLVNMTANELEEFYESEEGKEAGLSPKKAKELGIHYGRESARWIIKMKNTPVSEWTETMWEWAARQNSFISRMLGNSGSLYDSKGNKTRKHTSLLIWGHNPKKKK